MFAQVVTSLDNQIRHAQTYKKKGNSKNRNTVEESTPMAPHPKLYNCCPENKQETFGRLLYNLLQTSSCSVSHAGIIEGDL